MQYSITEFETLYTRAFPTAMKMAMSLLHDEDEALDVVHEVFLKLWESEAKMVNPTAFVIRAVRNTSLNRIAALTTREKIRQRLILEPPPDDMDPDTRHEEIRTAIGQVLTPREKEVVEKIYTEGLSYRDAAESLGVSVAAVNKNIVNALRKLRIHFKSGNND